MSNPNPFQDTDYLQKNQYRTSNNLAARAALHRRFSTAKVPWHSWVFSLMGLESGMRVLECGCGPGWLWRENVDYVPADCRITLTDLSPGMVAEAEAALANSSHRFDFQQTNIQSLDFADETFDVVVANHMLYHVPDLAQGLSEVRRVLQPGGRLIAATNGDNHMKELAELVPEVLQQSATSFRLRGGAPQISFRLENGRSLLAPYFAAVELHLYQDSLHITEVEPLLAYAFSMLPPGIEVPETAVTLLQEAWTEKLATEGAIKITKNAGLFVATKTHPG